MTTAISRRTLAKGAAWSAPVVVAAAAVPAYAASPTLKIDYGLFVTTSYNEDGGRSLLGYNETSGTGATNPTSPSAYFAASPRPESDLNWNDATSKPTNARRYQNGEGVFTPVTTSGSGINGTYASSSGFWWSVPTTQTNTGTNYIVGSSAVLNAGAVFVTQVEFTIPAGPDARWSADNVRIAGKLWNTTVSGSRTQNNATSATYLAVWTVPGNWVASTPVITANADGSYTFKGTITYTTTKAYNLTLNQGSSKFYGQTVIMPATIEVPTNYGWSYYQQTSYIQSATLALSDGKGTTDTLTLTGESTTSRLAPPK
ncbi:amino acid oxidase [Rothia nasimurium]|uniref:amino acid oxidase n=1 Tax=Rothia nasimurium TaxID=85336 RepID=UPI001F331EEE|nr:amino acid oxidase [Rothia nasimurium]